MIVSVAPNGRFLAATGDSGNVLVYGVGSGEGYVPLTSLPPLSDAGFSCAWDPTSTNFAVASQDGSITIWDVRSLGKQAKQTKIPSTQKTPKGAARCVKHSPAMSMDLVIFSEHSSFLNAVDARDFQKCQRIRLSQPGTDLNITGKSAINFE